MNDYSKSDLFIFMDELQKNAILQEFYKKINPTAEAISIFIDEYGFNEREKNSLLKIHTSFQSSIREFEKTISNNQPPNTIILIANAINNEFTRLIKQINHFLAKNQDNAEIPTIVLKVQSNILKFNNFLSKTLNSIPLTEDREKNINKGDKLSKKKERSRKSTINSKSSKIANSDSDLNTNLNSNSNKDQKQNTKLLTNTINLSKENNTDFDQKADSQTNKLLTNVINERENLLNQIQFLNSELKSCNSRTILLISKLSNLTNESSKWTQSYITESYEDSDQELFKILSEHKKELQSRIKKLSNSNNSISFQIENEIEKMHQITRNYKMQEDVFNKNIYSLIHLNSEYRSKKASLDKQYFDSNMEIHDLREMFKMEEKSTINSTNRLSYMTEQISSVEESNENFRKKIQFYQEKSNEIENDIQLMKSKKTTSKIEILYQQMLDEETSLFRTSQKYEKIVNSTIPNLKYKLSKISEEVKHLADLNKKEREESELINLLYLKKQIFNTFRF